MIPIGAIISLAGTAASGIMSAINNRKMQRERDAEYAREQAHYQAKANEDPLARSEVQAAVNRYDRDAEQTLNNARAYSIITGATPEYEAAVQKLLAQGKANLLSGVTAGASERKDKYEEMAEQSRQAQYAGQQKFNQSRNATYGALAANAANAFGSIVDSYSQNGMTWLEKRRLDKEYGNTGLGKITTPAKSSVNSVTVSAAPAPSAASIVANASKNIKLR